RQVCEREALKAMVQGDISSLGSHYLVSVQAIACANGDSLGREQEEAASKEGVLAALAKASRRLRARLGESIASIKAPPRLLDQANQVTTTSLEAYEQYAEAEAIRYAGSDRNAQPFYHRAIELDPNLAMAYARIGVYYVNQNESANA